MNKLLKLRFSWRRTITCAIVCGPGGRIGGGTVFEPLHPATPASATQRTKALKCFMEPPCVVFRLAVIRRRKRQSLAAVRRKRLWRRAHASFNHRVGDLSYRSNARAA